MKDFIQKARDIDDTIDEWFERAQSIRSEIQIEPNALDELATQNRPVRGASQPRMEDPSEDDKQNFKNSFVYPILDITLSKLNERFEQFTELSNVFEFLFDLHSKEISIDQCRRLETTFTSKQDGKKYINATQLFDEIKSFWYW